ncbi:MAG: DUF2029 domain-containing protein [Chloroflexi bacterium]|nr:DUF2029 domain-containing protein [Chloroflexota bacterium]
MTAAPLASDARPGRAARLGRAVLPVLAILIFVAATVAIAWAARDTLGYDYQAYVRAAERLVAGQALYDPNVNVAGPFAIFLYPPPFALAMVPFSWLPAGTGPAVWTAVLAIAYVLGVAILPVRRDVRWVTLLLAGICWPFLYSIKLGQVGPLLFLAFAAGWRWRDRPGILGAAIAIGALIKVQPAILFGWALATGRRRAVVIGVVILVGASLVATAIAGSGVWLDYVAILGRVSSPVTTPHNYTPGALAYGAGASLAVATAIQWGWVALAVAIVLGAWWRADAETGYVTTAIASQVISPLLWEHYAMLLLLPTALLLERRQWWAVALPLLPWLGPPAYPIVFLAGLIGPILTAPRRGT